MVLLVHLMLMVKGIYYRSEKELNMQIELKQLQLSDADTLYEFFQKLPASENVKMENFQV